MHAIDDSSDAAIRRYPKRLSVFLIGAIALGAAAPASSQVLEQRENLVFFDTGPLRIREQFLPTVGFLSLEPASAAVLEPGHWQVDLVQTGTNTWVGTEKLRDDLTGRPPRTPVRVEELRAVDDDGGVYFADGEVYRTSASVRLGLGGGFAAELTVPVVDFRGGFGDQLIEEFHDTFGLEDAQRPAVPQDDFTLYLRDVAGNEVYRQQPASSGLSDVTVALKRRIPTGSDRLLAAVQAVAKLATGDEEDLYGSGSSDYGAQLLVARYSDHSCIHLAVGAVRLGESEVFGLDEQTRYAALLAYEHQLTPTSSVVLQVQGTESPFQDLAIRDLGDEAFLFDVGVKKGFGRNTVVFLALSENVVNFRNSADVGLHLGLTWTH